MRRGGCQRDTGTDTVAEAQLSGALCAEEMEGGGKDSPINPLGMQPNHGWERLPPLLDLTTYPCPESDPLPLLPCPHGMQEAAPGLVGR